MQNNKIRIASQIVAAYDLEQIALKDNCGDDLRLRVEIYRSLDQHSCWYGVRVLRFEHYLLNPTYLVDSVDSPDTSSNELVLVVDGHLSHVTHVVKSETADDAIAEALRLIGIQLGVKLFESDTDRI